MSDADEVRVPSSGHFVPASCEGNLCSVCKAPAMHKLGEEIPHDEPKPPCPDCGRNWVDLSATVQERVQVFGRATR